MSDKIIDQVKTIPWSESREEAEREANRKLFPFERKTFLDSLPFEENPHGGDPKLNREFRRIDAEAALNMLKTQEGIPFPVPRFAMLDLEKDDEVVFWFSDAGGEHHHQELRTSRMKNESGEMIRRWNEGTLITYVPGNEAMDKIRAPFRESASQNENRLRKKSLLLFLAAIAFGACSIPIFFFVGWPLGTATTLVSIVLGCLSLGCKDAAITEWHRRDSKIHRLRAKPNGFVPERVRNKIKEHKDKFEGVFLMFEANWSWKEEPKPANPDPLVLGYASGWYVIADFDLTDKEKFLRDEFTFDAGKRS